MKSAKASKFNLASKDAGDPRYATGNTAIPGGHPHRFGNKESLSMTHPTYRKKLIEVGLPL